MNRQKAKYVVTNAMVQPKPIVNNGFIGNQKKQEKQNAPNHAAFNTTKTSNLKRTISKAQSPSIESNNTKILKKKKKNLTKYNSPNPESNTFGLQKPSNPFNMESSLQDYEDMTYTVSKLSESLTMTELREVLQTEEFPEENQALNEAQDDDNILNIQIRSPKVAPPIQQENYLSIVQQDQKEIEVMLQRTLKQVHPESNNNLVHMTPRNSALGQSEDRDGHPNKYHSNPNQNSNSQNIGKPMTTLSGLRPKINKKQIIGLAHPNSIESEGNSNLMSDGRNFEIVETFYDQSIPSRYRLYPVIQDDDKNNSRNASLKSRTKGNTYSHIEDGILISGTKLQDKTHGFKLYLPASDSTGKLHKTLHITPQFQMNRTISKLPPLIPTSIGGAQTDLKPYNGSQGSSKKKNVRIKQLQMRTLDAIAEYQRITQTSGFLKKKSGTNLAGGGGHAGTDNNLLDSEQASTKVGKVPQEQTKNIDHLTQISEGSVDGNKEGSRSTNLRKGPGRITNLKMFKQKMELEMKRDKLSRNVASITSNNNKGSLNDRNSFGGVEADTAGSQDKNNSNLFLASVYQQEETYKRQSMGHDSKMSYLANLTSTDLRKVLQGISQIKARQPIDQTPIMIQRIVGNRQRGSEIGQQLSLQNYKQKVSDTNVSVEVSIQYEREVQQNQQIMPQIRNAQSLPPKQQCMILEDQEVKPKFKISEIITKGSPSKELKKVNYGSIQHIKEQFKRKNENNHQSTLSPTLQRAQMILKQEKLLIEQIKGLEGSQAQLKLKDVKKPQMVSSYVANGSPKANFSPQKYNNNLNRPWGANESSIKANLDLYQQTSDGRLESLLNPKALIGFNPKQLGKRKISGSPKTKSDHSSSGLGAGRSHSPAAKNESVLNNYSILPVPDQPTPMQWPSVVSNADIIMFNKTQAIFERVGKQIKPPIHGKSRLPKMAQTTQNFYETKPTRITGTPFGKIVFNQQPQGQDSLQQSRIDTSHQQSQSIGHKMNLYLPEASFLSSTPHLISDQVSQKRVLIQKISVYENDNAAEKYQQEEGSPPEMTVVITDRTNFQFQMLPMGEPQS